MEGKDESFSRTRASGNVHVIVGKAKGQRTGDFSIECKMLKTQMKSTGFLVDWNDSECGAQLVADDKNLTRWVKRDVARTVARY
jgi:hypothetical protein